MDTDKIEKNNIKKISGILIIILSLVTSTYLIMLWISPDSKYLGKFLFSFGFLFASIVLIAYCINYINEIYKQMKNRT